LCLGQGGSAGASPRPAYAQHAWEYGPFADFGVGTGNRSDYKFFNAGFHAGRVLTSPSGPGILRGQFENASEIMPFWQAYTPGKHIQTVTYVVDGTNYVAEIPFGGGTFTGASITPIILRWNLDGMSSRKLLPWIQGAGGLIWTNHKFPPDFLVQHGQPGGTSVFNFTPQFGIGLHYFVKPQRSIDFSANAVHISSASLGDHNPGVNASVQFELGYSWWK
jgi:hypothetical protein